MDDSSTGDHSLQSHYPAIIIGGGQAGLSMSYCLKERGIDHLVFEKHRLGEAWRSKRWDSFCLVTPNWQCQLPGFPYAGDDPKGFMPRDEIVAYIDAYARHIAAPIREGVAVVRLAHRPGELGRATSRLGEKHINIDYSYCGLEPGSTRALAVFGVDNLTAAATLLDELAAENV